MRARLAALLIGGLALAGLTGCQEPDRTTIVFLVASDRADRWVSLDEPAVRAQVRRTCRGCEFISHNALTNVDTQARQMSEALEDGADVIVLNPVDAERAEELVQQAGDVPVIAYDSFVAGADYFVTYDPARIGTLLADGVVDEAGDRPSILMVNGATVDPNAVAIRSAAHARLDKAPVSIVAELEPKTWTADEAAAWVTRQLERRPVKAIDAILVANDAQAGGVVEALRRAGVDPVDFPTITGQDAELAAVRRIVTGEQTMTVYKSIRAEAHQAADIAVQLAVGGDVVGAVPFEGVPSFILDPVAVTLQNLTDTVVRDGLYTPAQICDDATAARCEVLGIR